MIEIITKAIPVALLIFLINMGISITKNMLRSLSTNDFEEILLRKDQYKMTCVFKLFWDYLRLYSSVVFMVLLLYPLKLQLLKNEVIQIWAFGLIGIMFWGVSIVYIFKRIIFRNLIWNERIKKIIPYIFAICVVLEDFTLGTYLIKEIIVENIWAKHFSCVLISGAALFIMFIVFKEAYIELFNITKKNTYFKFNSEKEKDDIGDLYFLRGIDKNQMILMDKKSYEESERIYVHDIDEKRYLEFEKKQFEI